MVADHVEIIAIIQVITAVEDAVVMGMDMDTVMAVAMVTVAVMVMGTDMVMAAVILLKYSS